MEIKPRKLMSIFNIFTWLSFGVSFVVGIETREYIKNEVFSGYTCAGFNYDFGERRSVITCVASCATIDTCYSLLYDNVAKTCIGKQGILLSTSGCTSRPNVSYYAFADYVPTTTSTTITTTTTTTTPPPSQHGLTCMSNSDCPMSNTECNLQSCQCAPPNVYNPQTDTCVASCGTYGSTYIHHVDHVLQVSTLSDTYVSVAACKATCNGDSRCKGFNYVPGTSQCRTKESSIASATSSFTPWTGVDYYARNCQ